MTQDEDADLEDWRRHTEPPSSASPLLTVDGFEGPLDWLVGLARARRIDLGRLSILALMEAFEAALTDALSQPVTEAGMLGRWGAWLVMAAELTLLRSRLLLPADAVEAQDALAEVDALRRRIEHRAAAAAGADWLQARPQLGRDTFSRTLPDAGAPMGGRTGDVTALLRACLAVLRLPAGMEEAFRLAGPPAWSVADALHHIRRLLPDADGRCELGHFLPALVADLPDQRAGCRTALASTFVAGLEIAREGLVQLEQDGAWQTIMVCQVLVP